jgi:hypothetical protein
MRAGAWVFVIVGCAGTRHLDPPPPPPAVFPAVMMPPTPPPDGAGRVVLDVVDGPVLADDSLEHDFSLRPIESRVSWVPFHFFDTPKYRFREPSDIDACRFVRGSWCECRDLLWKSG